MATGEPRHLSQGVDFLGFMGAKLRDLKGISTLAYELIQNADDVKDEEGRPGASRISFDVRDDALIVENDGVFREVDFSRMQQVASEGKREEVGTTGAFGIGFIAVYQVTDRPELLSSGKRWTFRPEMDEGDRIEQYLVPSERTRFRLPWAFDPDSEVRRRLRVEPVQPTQLTGFANEIARAVSAASLFLKQIRYLEVKRNGVSIKTVEREHAGGDETIILEDNHPLIWRFLYGGFEQEARRMRDQYSQIEDKRQYQVVIAVPDEEITKSRLYAVLPSDTPNPLPFHINADFFPSSDRKRILFGNDFQSDWNRAAVTAAAEAVAHKLDHLIGILDHVGLWRLLQSMDQCWRDVQSGKHDEAFAGFWEKAAPLLSSSQIVYTTAGQWVRPGEARLLESDEELEASSILEGLGIQVVHPDLRPYFGLLRQNEVGTPRLTVQDVVEVLRQAGLSQRTPLAQAPKGLRTIDGWQKLWRALDALLERRQTSYEKEQAIACLRSCAIALGQDGALWIPSDLSRGNSETGTLFRGVPWLKEVEGFGNSSVPGRLVPEFNAKRAIEVLFSLSPKHLTEVCCHGELDVAALYDWFEARKPEILSRNELIEGLRALSIWPAAGKLRPLEGVYISTGFDEDPLDLPILVDLKTLGGRKEFLKDLGVQGLTFQVYAREQVPRVLREKADLTREKRRQLVQLLAKRLGEIRDDWQLRQELHGLDLVECTDGAFRPARDVYLKADVLKVLGDHVHVAAETSQNADAVEALYEWLEVARESRPGDVIAQVKCLCSEGRNPQSHKSIQDIFAYLVNSWPRWEAPLHDCFAPLRSIGWLPGTSSPSHWFRPSDLYAVFQRYLFGTQANFLDLPPMLQRQAGTAKLIEFLEIEDTPSPDLVVKHLLACCGQKKEINRQVYRFLNDSAHDPSLDRLRGKACLLMEDGRYVRPDQVFWSEHPFGKFRVQLGQDFRSYSALLDRLGVNKKPEIKDYQAVLLEISEQYQQHKAALDDQTFAVLMGCWEALSTALEKADINAHDLAELRRHKVIPDGRRMLNLPENIFFEDRAGLAARFHGFLEQNAIQRPQGAWRAMEAVGVRLLWREAVETHLVESPDSAEDTDLAAHIKERRPLVARAVESDKASVAEDLDEAVLDRLQFERASQLVIRHSLNAFRQHRFTDAESVPALLMPREHTVYVVHENGHIAWPAVARELAYAIKTAGEIGGLAGGIKEALAPDSYEEASRTLDELGYPPLLQREPTQIAAAGAAAGFGGTDLGEDEDKAGFGTSIDQPGMDDTPMADTETGKQAVEDPIAAILGGDAGRADMPPTGPEFPAGGRPGQAAGTGQRKRRKSSRIVSYVYPEDALADPSKRQSVNRRPKVEKAGIDHVISYGERLWTEHQVMPPNHPGYDIRAIDEEGREQYMEVKALSGTWDSQNPAQLTRTEFAEARKKGERYWLYVVEYATSKDAQVYRIQDPANKASHYLFDHGWIPLSETQPSPTPDDKDD